jgi:glycosyltransferase involved in cell wall biosynthesis
LNEEQVEVKTNFVEDFNLPDVERGDHYLYVGRLTEEKGIATLLKAFSQSNLKLVIAGDGPMRDEVQKAAQSNDNISYIGFRSHDEIQKELKKCSSLIFPSTWYECAPMTLIEAYAGKTPIIASNIGVMLSMIIDKVTGLHFEAGNPQDLVKKLEYWQSLPKEEKRIYYANARCYYEENHTPEKILEKMINIYYGLLSKKKTQTRLYQPSN